MFVPFYVLISISFTSTPTLGMVSVLSFFFKFSLLILYVSISHLICISPMNNNIESFWCAYLPFVYFYFVKTAHFFLQFFLYFAAYILWSFQSYLFILDTSSLLEIWLIFLMRNNIFSQFIVCLHHLTVFFKNRMF